MTLLTDDTKLRLLLEISSKIRSQVETSLNLDATLDLVLKTLAQLIPHDVAAIRLSDGPQNLHRSLVRRLDSSSPDSGPAYSPADLGSIGIDSLAARLEAPILFDGRAIGSILIGLRSQGSYAEADREILDFFAREVAYTIEKALLHEDLLAKKRLESELEVARQVQLSLLPAQVPVLPGYDMAALSIPAAGVGGDYYDFVGFPEDNVGLVIADVVGKGMSAALIMASFRAFLRAQIRNDYAIATIFRKVNNLLKEGLDDNRFVTAVYGVLDSRNRVLTYCNAGHNPPLLFTGDGNVVQLTRGGTVVGAFFGAEYKESRRNLKPGDVLLLYTDGLIEAHNSSDEEYGAERVILTVQANRRASAQELCSRLLENVTAHRRESPLSDDLTLMVVKVG
ncbi:MAG TPA: GAF domain-containing SpoIIE family protein phosphatase [Acidobacteriota bacterium]|jgi:sigma-B regulation protein RsbU (phosphoserine phosphatase)